MLTPDEVLQMWAEKATGADDFAGSMVVLARQLLDARKVIRAYLHSGAWRSNFECDCCEAPEESDGKIRHIETMYGETCSIEQMMCLLPEYEHGPHQDTP